MIDLIHLRTCAYQTLTGLSQYKNIETPHKKIRALRRFLLANYYFWLGDLTSCFLLPLLFYLPRDWPMYMQISLMISFFEILSLLKLYIDCKREGGFVYFRAGDLNIPAGYFGDGRDSQINSNLNLACICLDPSLSLTGDSTYLYVDFSSNICKSFLISTSKTEAQLKN